MITSASSETVFHDDSFANFTLNDQKTTPESAKNVIVDFVKWIETSQVPVQNVPELLDRLQQSIGFYAFDAEAIHWLQTLCNDPATTLETICELLESSLDREDSILATPAASKAARLSLDRTTPILSAKVLKFSPKENSFNSALDHSDLVIDELNDRIQSRLDQELERNSILNDEMAQIHQVYQKEKSELEEQMLSYELEISRLQKLVISSDKRNEELQEQFDTLECCVEDWKRKFFIEEEKNEVLTSQLKQLQSNDLRQELNDKNEQLEEMYKQVNELEQAISNNHNLDLSEKPATILKDLDLVETADAQVQTNQSHVAQEDLDRLFADIELLEQETDFLRSNMHNFQEKVMETRRIIDLRKSYDAELCRWVDTVKSEVQEAESNAKLALDQLTQTVNYQQTSELAHDSLNYAGPRNEPALLQGVKTSFWIISTYLLLVLYSIFLRKDDLVLFLDGSSLNLTPQ